MGVTTARAARGRRARHTATRARASVDARKMSSEDPATGLMARGASTAYGTESRAREANGVEDERVAEVRRARRIGARTRGSGIAVAVAVALACALAVAAVREGAAGRSRATARLGGTANERGNFFGAPLSAEARMRAPAKADVINRISLRTRVPGLRSPGRGVPGLRTHVRETQRASDDARILILTKPFEWGMTYLQIQSVKRWAPALLPHVTVLTYDTETQRSCEAHRGVDCFYDADFARAYGQDPNDGVARDAMSWRKVHAALELLKARIPVVMLDSDTVFLSDPTEAWTSALEKYDVVVSSDVGNEFEAQGNMNTKLVIFPATTRSVSLCERWLEGESRLVSKVNYGEFPEQSYFNYVLVPTTAGEFHIHAMSTVESGNFHHRQRGRRWYVPRRAHRHGVVLRRRARQGTIPPARPRNQAQRRSRARNRARRHDRHSITIRHRFRPRRRGRPRAVPAPRPSMRPRKASPRGPAPIRGHLRPAHRVDVARAQTLAQQHVTRIRSS